MKIFLAGECHGKISALYNEVDRLENKLDVRADWVLQTGNFGVWPDPQRVDRTTRINYQDDLEFHHYYSGAMNIPRPTLFVPGKHEDHSFLTWKKSKGQLEIIYNLNLLLNGFSTKIGENETVSLIGLGNAYSPKTYNGDRRNSSHYQQKDVAKACSHPTNDILLTHEAGAGATLGTHLSQAEGINDIVYNTRTKLHVHSHYNFSQVYRNPITKVLTISLAFGEVRVIDYADNKFTLLD